MNKERNSNYELMRIVSMFLIVLYHIIYHGKVLFNTSGMLKNIFEIIEFTTLVHVNSFVLLSGYFQVDSKFKQSKFWSITNATLFYKIMVLILFSFLGIMTFSKTFILEEIFPININQYWFIKIYLLLYCLSPFINKAISNFDKKTFKGLLILLFVVFSILPTITGNKAFANNGYTLSQFVYLYLIGAYLKKYPISLRKSTLILIFIGSILLNYILYRISLKIIGINALFDQISLYIRSSSILYSNPFVLIQSVSYFLLFGMIKLNNKFINKISALSFGVYLIHDNELIRPYLYNWLKIDVGLISNYSFILYVFMVAILIYVVCSLIEYVRQLMFRFIYERKISKKIRNQYYNYLGKLKIKCGI